MVMTARAIPNMTMVTADTVHSMIFFMLLPFSFYEST
jgi:hypothetical protein